MTDEDQTNEELEGAALDLAEEISATEIALTPTDTGDPASIVDEKIPKDIRERYEVYSYRNAATILSETRKVESQTRDVGRPVSNSL